MAELRALARVYIVTLVALAAALLVIGLGGAGGQTAGTVVLALAFCGLMVLAGYFELDFTYRTKITLDTAVTFAAVLLFAPGVAMLVAGVGIALAHVILRDPPVETVFNAAQTALQAAAAGWLLALAGWEAGAIRVDEPGLVVAVPLAAGVIHLVNTLIVSVIVALQTGLAVGRVWLQSVSIGGVEDVAQFALGLLAALVVDAHPWALPLLLLPAIVVYRSIQRQHWLQVQTVEAVEALADIVDLRDPYTANHSRRVAIYARELATALGLGPAEVDVIERAGRVHDVGKIVVDLRILTQDGRLSDAEWEQLKRHPMTGAEILSRFPEFTLATSYVRHHHETVNGDGYPDGLRGERIPLGARVLAVADSFDAMASARPYRTALPAATVLAEFRGRRGEQWDADVVDALLALVESGRIVVPGASPSPPELLDRRGVTVPLPVVGADE